MHMTCHIVHAIGYTSRCSWNEARAWRWTTWLLCLTHGCTLCKHAQVGKNRSIHNLTTIFVCLAGGGWLVLICSDRKVLSVGCCFVYRGKYCCLVADKVISQTNRAPFDGMVVYNLTRSTSCRGKCRFDDWVQSTSIGLKSETEEPVTRADVLLR
jgi:hypothetical protein